MRQDQLRTYITRRDINLKLLKSNQVLAIKNKRAKFRKQQSNIITKQKKLIGNKRNFNNISNRQVKKFDKKIKKSIKQRQKLKFNNNKGDVALGKVIAPDEKWISNFASSNVFKFKRVRNNLQVMFLDGSIYMYFGVGKFFIGLLNAGSKGKWIWKQLIRKAINYIKIR